MIILEKPYASDLMLQWLEESQHPVLSNSFAKELALSGRQLHLVPDAEAAALIDKGSRVYTCSENALDWVLANTEDKELHHCIQICKDKALTRRALAQLDSKLFFKECTMDELLATDEESLPYPLVVKPSVGFISFGVHVVNEASEWRLAIQALQEEIAGQDIFPESVIGGSSFIIEGFITGQEYAVDVYFDQDGAPVILDVMQHDFRDGNDTSDHLYYTSPKLMSRTVSALTAWFDHANQELGFKDFCTHVEIRVSHREDQDPADAMAEADNIHVIEFNPLRFAGFCGTDLGFYAYGIRTYQWYLDNEKPNWEQIAREHSADGITAFVVMEAPSGWSEDSRVDMEKFQQELMDSCPEMAICELRPLDPGVHGLSCFPILRIPANADDNGFKQFALNLNADRYLA